MHDLCKLRKLIWTNDIAEPLNQVSAVLALNMADIPIDCAALKKLPTPGQRVKLGSCSDKTYELGQRHGHFYLRRS